MRAPSWNADLCIIAIGVGLAALASSGMAQQPASTAIPREVMRQILRAEDLQIWDDGLLRLLADPNPRVRERAALAAGRTGKPGAVFSLTPQFPTGPTLAVQAAAAFALGELETTDSVTIKLLGDEALKDFAPVDVRARAVEALGKIGATLDAADETQRKPIGDLIVRLLEAEIVRSPNTNRELVSLALTAALRVRPANAGPAIATYLSSPDAGIRATAANTLARLRSKDGLERARVLAATDPDPIVRANAVRMLGAAVDVTALDILAARLTGDADSRVRISAIRALGALKDAKAVPLLLNRGNSIGYVVPSTFAPNTEPLGLDSAGLLEALEIATALGQILPNTSNAEALVWLRSVRANRYEPEIEVAFARIAPALYLREQPFATGSAATMASDWRRISAWAQGLGAIAAAPPPPAGSTNPSPLAEAQSYVRRWLESPTLAPQAASDVLTAFAEFKPPDLDQIASRFLEHADFIVRATAAGLIGDLPPSEANSRALAAALPRALRDADNDAALSILEALAAQKTPAANEATKVALDSPDYLTRQRAVTLLKASGDGDFSARLGSVNSRNTAADYDRALDRIGHTIRATVVTTKGEIVIELRPDAAPMTVDNFVQLARRGFYNGISFHRVVPNFVVQAGDPRGDGSGGPGYSIRDEINDLPFDRGALGMALSGKDTGGSQWFITHSPQPHLDGGYTVFGRVTSGMDVVDRIARGDVIRTITIQEN